MTAPELRAVIERLRRSTRNTDVLDVCDALEARLGSDTRPLWKHSLYRHFDADGVLLYVGISINAINRLGQHKTNSEWFGKIHRVEIIKFETDDLVRNAEIYAIKTEKPLHNVTYNQPGPNHAPTQAVVQVVASVPRKAVAATDCPKCTERRSTQRTKMQRYRGKAK